MPRPRTFVDRIAGVGRDVDGRTPRPSGGKLIGGQDFET